ncbi:MAG: M24 family metallopeptidase [Planctomycetales bacterium]
MFDTAEVQAALHEFHVDAWLLYDFRGSNVLARRVLGLSDEAVGSRRFFYLVPAHGAPRKFVHRIEAGALDDLPGEKRVYLRWQELEAGVRALVEGFATVAMEYSPRNANPYVSRVDAGTVELVRSCGPAIVSSGDLVQRFEATWTDAMWQLHLAAEKHTQSAFDLAWKLIAERTRDGGRVDEREVCDAILDHFARNGMTTYHPPIVARAPHSGDPHYETGTGSDTAIRTGDLVMIDLWAKIDHPDGVYSDLTRMGFVGETVPREHAEVFAIVARARDAAIDRVRAAFDSGEPLQGWQVDRAARDRVEAAGHGERFVHRTGHSIGRETHGNGANMDDLETREERRVLPRTCFSIEPGIYLPEFGIRSEVNVYVAEDGTVHVTGGPPQTEILPIFREFRAAR